MKIVERMKKDEWIIAFRRKGTKTFTLLPNTVRYWCADPFLLEGKYLLFEMYDRLKGKGLIGYRVHIGEEWTKPKILIEDESHLSYPFVYREGDKFYIVPESSNAGYIYRMELSFSEEKLSVKDKIIIKNGCYADTTMAEIDGNKYWFTTPIIEDNVSRLCIYTSDFCETINLDSDINRSNARMGGNFIHNASAVYRVSQDCTNGYGKALNYSRCTITDKRYSEELIKKLTIDDIVTDSRYKFDGIHTYNSDGKYEVIDLKREKVFNVVRLIGYVLTKFRILKR